ncbi:MAG: hypothetical protein A2148_01575 [Chloroflexi bacterium RBG_16_68_14]|nr:MAG: hypothetical protein A2148_01575 [Chloroflexi bacterium RBG_16_68_14]
MRILSLGFPMPGPSVDNHTFANAPTFFDYDALVVDPQALSRLIEEVVSGSAEHTTRSGERVVNAPTSPDAVGLADLLRDRQEETARLLARGGLVVCFAYPNVVHHQVASFTGCDRYFWLPAPPGLQYREPFLRRGTGSEIIPTEHDHPFGPFVHQFRGKLAYQAYFADDAPGFPDLSGRVFARSAGGAAVALELSLGRGRAVFLPPPVRPPSGDQRYAYSNALQDAIRHTLRLAATSGPPAWLHEHELPGLSERLAARDEAERQVAQAQDALTAAEERVQELDRYRRLLWQEGKYGLEEPVRDALALLGFRLVPQDIDTPAQVHLEVGRRGQQVALLEVEASDEAVGMDGHYRLRRRLEEAIAGGKPKRGLLIINGYRTQPPSQRAAQYQDALRVAAESLRYCVTTTEQLFHACRAALEGDEATVHAFRERLLTTEGVLKED